MPTLEAARLPDITYGPHQLTVDDVYHDVRERAAQINEEEFYGKMGVARTELVEVAIPGPHTLLVLNEADGQETNAFKVNGAVNAVAAAFQRSPDLEEVVVASKGNWGAGVARAAARVGLRTTVMADENLNDAKRSLLESNGAKVEANYPDLDKALSAAEESVATTNRNLAPKDHKAVFLHPYDNPDGIAGQAMVGKRILESLYWREAEGLIDLHNDPVVIKVQIGGGSLVTGVACMVMDAKRRGLVGDNVVVEGVRPEGGVDTRYDGLAVEDENIGTYAKHIVNNQRFVCQVTTVNDVDTGRAAHRYAWAFNGRRYEPAGLAGQAAFEREAPLNEIPTTYVTIATGANVTPKTYAEFADAPRRYQDEVLAGLSNTAFKPLASFPTNVMKNRSLIATSPVAK